MHVPSDPDGLLVSVLTPAYNAASTLERAYRSLREQDIQQWEYVIINDGSTDGTAQIAEGIAAADPRVKVVTTENRGNGATHNEGLRQSTGPVIAFLDADDEYLAGHLRKRLEYMATHPSVDAIWGGLEVVAALESDAYVPDMVKGRGLIHASECVVQGTIMLRRHVVDRLKFTEDRSTWYADFEFMERVRKEFRVERFPDITYRYYRNSGVSTVDKAKAAMAGD